MPLPSLDQSVKMKLPPLLDARILLLTRDEDAATKNAKLGASDCAVFPGLKDDLWRIEHPSSEEEWEAPFCGGDTSSEED